MKENITNVPGNKYELAIELASLIGNNPKLLIDIKKLTIFKKALSELEKDNKEKTNVVLNDNENFELSSKEIKQKINQIKKYFSTLSINSSIESLAEGNIDISSIELSDLLKLEDLDTFTISRIKELFSDKEINNIYSEELKKREDNFGIVSEGNKYLIKILKIDEQLKRTNKYILGLGTRAFRENRKLNQNEISLIKIIRQRQEDLNIGYKGELLEYKEVAIAYRLYNLKSYKKQLDRKGFVITPSRQKYIEEIETKLLTGKSILLTGGTGTGKTALAVNAISNIQNSLVQVSGKAIQDEFVEVLSGNSGTRTSDFIAKIKLTEGKNGGIQTSSELGKILKAFVDGKIPVIDEIDLIPTDILMRIKHLFTLRPGDEYSPQENGNEKYVLKNTTLIATANIKSDKHEDREELDPAIIRLFDGININYFPKQEVYDLALASLMSRNGFIPNISVSELDGDESILIKLIYALKDIEQNYLGFGEGETITDQNSDVGNMYLQKAVLETGKFMGLFKGFNSSENNFSKYITEQVIDFISNGAYPKTDRLILLKIFSSKGIIGEGIEMEILKDKMQDISSSDIEKSIITGKTAYAWGIKFIDPYELANLDPFNEKPFEGLEYINSDINLIELFREMDANIYEDDHENNEYFEYIENKLAEIQDYYNLNRSIELTQKDKEQIMGALHELSLEYFVEKLGNFEDFKECYQKIQILKESEEKEKQLKLEKQYQLAKEIDEKYEEKEIEIKNKISKIEETIEKYEDEFHKNIDNISEVREKIENFNNTAIENLKEMSGRDDDYFINKSKELAKEYIRLLINKKIIFKEHRIFKFIKTDYEIEEIILKIKVSEEKEELGMDNDGMDYIERYDLIENKVKIYDFYKEFINETNKEISEFRTEMSDNPYIDDLNETLNELLVVDESLDDFPIRYKDDGELYISEEDLNNIIDKSNISL